MEGRQGKREEARARKERLKKKQHASGTTSSYFGKLISLINYLYKELPEALAAGFKAALDTSLEEMEREEPDEAPS